MTLNMSLLFSSNTLSGSIGSYENGRAIVVVVDTLHAVYLKVLAMDKYFWY